MQNEFTVKLSKLIENYVEAVAVAQYDLEHNLGMDEQHPAWLALKAAENEMNDEIAWLGIQMLTLQSENKRLKSVPMQPVHVTEHNVVRFKKNALVDALYEHGVETGLGLNELATMDFTDEDRRQFAQLIGYSLRGYCTLSYVDDDAYLHAEEAGRIAWSKHTGVKDE